MRRTRNRTGFTLIEMLVVIGIMLVIAGLIALLMPNWAQRGRVNSAAVQVQQWFLVAKQMAVLDQAPRGVRLLPDPNNPNLLTKLQYIKQPEDFAGGQISTFPGDTSVVQIENVSLDLFGGNPSNPNVWLIQPGDHVQIGGSGMVRQIKPLNPADPTYSSIIRSGGKYSLDLKSPFIYPVDPPTSAFKIIRGPRIMGEEALDLANDIAIDLSTNDKPYAASYGGSITRNGNNSTDPVDIMFAPNGAVMGNWSRPKIIFWVRDTTFDTEFEGDPSLVVIYTRTGLIDSFEIDERTINRNDPFSIVD